MSTVIYINGRFLTQSITGVQRVAREFLIALDSLIEYGKLDVEAVVLHPGKSDVLPIDQELKHVRLKPCGRFVGHLWEQVELPFYARGGKLLCLGNTAPIYSLLYKSDRVHVMVHDLSYKYFPKAYSWKFRLFYSIVIPQILKRASKVYTVSKSEYESILTHYPNLIGDDRLSYHQNGGWSNYKPEARPSYSSRKKRILYVGSLTARKNAKGLLEAAIKIVSAHPELEFSFLGSNGASFGDVDLEILEELKSNINFLGQVNDAAVLKGYYESSLALVFPSFYEASPLPPIESMGFGCPVVSSSIKSLKERCGDAAIYCEADDVDDIVRSIEKIIYDEEVWVKYSKLGINKALEYTWEKQVADILKIMEVI